MRNYIIYSETSGRIVRCMSCPATMIEIQCAGDELYTEHDMVDDNLYYILGGEIAPRPDFPVSISGNILSGVPEATIVTIEGQAYTADGSDIEFEPTSPGTYEISLQRFPYRATTLDVTV